MKMVASSLVLSLALALMTPVFPFAQVARTHAHDESVNLIANNTISQIDPVTKKPVGWQTGGWGNNLAQFRVMPYGLDRTTKSLYVSVSNYVDGDAKWYFAPVAIQPNTSYTYSDQYRASVPTQIIAMIEDSSGNLFYQHLGAAEKSTSWKDFSVTFTTSATAKKISIFHLLATNGYLYSDNFNLKVAYPTPPTPAPGDNFVPNSSVEQADPAATSKPLSWQNNSWGTHKPIFTYLQEGHTGTRSLKTEVTSYTSGDAKWYFTPQPIAANTHYTVSDYYKSNVTTQVVVMIQTTSGTQYIGLKNVPAASNWTQYSDTFVTPQNATHMSVFHVLAGVGYLITDDYRVVAYTHDGFSRALVSLTFDDGWKSQRTNGLPVMQKYGVPSTQYITTGFLNHDPYMSDTDVSDFKAAGHQIAAHTVSHEHLRLLSPTDLAYQLTHSRDDLQAKFGPIAALDFASPYGEYNTAVITALKNASYRSHRSVEAGYNSKDNLNLWDIRVQNIFTTTTQNEVSTWLDRAKADNTWLVLVYHQVNQSGSTYSVTPQNLEGHIQAIKNRNLPVVTVDQAISEVLPQLP